MVASGRPLGVPSLRATSSRLSGWVDSGACSGTTPVMSPASANVLPPSEASSGTRAGEARSPVVRHDEKRQETMNLAAVPAPVGGPGVCLPASLSWIETNATGVEGLRELQVPNCCIRCATNGQPRFR